MLHRTARAKKNYSESDMNAAHGRILQAGGQ
jgi:hypothetical protein